MSATNIHHALIQEYFRIYPAEAAPLLNSLPSNDVLRLLQAEPIPTALEVFVRLNPDKVTELIAQMENDFFRELFTKIDPNRGSILLARLDSESIEKRLLVLPDNLAKEFRELMNYPRNSAGYLMDARVTTFRREDTVEEVLKKVRTLQRRIIDICLVDDEGKLLGVVPLQEVAIAPPKQQIGELVLEKLIGINALAPREDVVSLLDERKLTSLPVVDLEGKLLGIIRYDRLISAAEHHISEDVQTMFGAGRDERALSKATFAIRKRLPWLEINLATAFLAAAVVGLFEGTIAKFTALAIFLPVVAGQSGNTGSQALAVTMRGLALREIRTRHWLRIVRKEFTVGFINGCAVALTTSLIVYIWMGSIGLASIIGTSMVFSMVVASLSGAVIPVILKAFGQDPAQSSSIILTTVTDVVGFMSFLGLATLLSGILNIA